MRIAEQALIRIDKYNRHWFDVFQNIGELGLC